MIVDPVAYQLLIISLPRVNCVCAAVCLVKWYHDSLPCCLFLHFISQSTVLQSWQHRWLSIWRSELSKNVLCTPLHIIILAWLFPPVSYNLPNDYSILPWDLYSIQKEKSWEPACSQVLVQTKIDRKGGVILVKRYHDERFDHFSAIKNLLI